MFISAPPEHLIAEASAALVIYLCGASPLLAFYFPPLNRRPRKKYIRGELCSVLLLQGVDIQWERRSDEMRLIGASFLEVAGEAKKALGRLFLCSAGHKKLTADLSQ